MRRSWKRWGVGVASVSLVLGVAGCSSSDGAGAGGSTDAARVDEAHAFVEEAMAEAQPEPAEPVEPPADRRVGILNCGEGAEDCNKMTAAAQKAVESLGWSAEVVDGKLSPQGFAAGLSKLINDGVDGIVMIAVPDAAVPQQMKAASEAGIPVACVVCSNGELDPIEHPSVANSDVDYELEGKMMAEYIIAASEGSAKVAVQTDALGGSTIAVDKANRKVLETCGGCEIVDEVEVGQPADVIGNARSYAQAALSRLPKGEVDYLLPPSDGTAAGVRQAIAAMNRTEVKVVGAGCNEETLAQMGESDPIEPACVNTDLEWLSWAGVDGLVRVFAGADSWNQDIPIQLITAENAPAAGESATTFDFEAYYLESWGV